MLDLETLRAGIGVPVKPAAKLTCPDCGNPECAFVSATLWEFGEPTYYAYCKKCALRLCPFGHRVTKVGRPFAGVLLERGFNNKYKSTAVYVCAQEQCVGVRATVRATFEAAALDAPDAGARMFAFAGLKNGTPVDGWLFSAADHLVRVDEFFRDLREDTPASEPAAAEAVPVAAAKKERSAKVEESAASRSPESAPGEEWRPFLLAERYFVSTHGRLWDAEQGRLVKVSRRRSEPLTWSVVIDGARERVLCADAVLRTHAGSGWGVVYADGDPENFALSNLSWKTPSRVST
jgi:hypothetical protein